MRETRHQRWLKTQTHSVSRIYDNDRRIAEELQKQLNVTTAVGRPPPACRAPPVARRTNTVARRAAPVTRRKCATARRVARRSTHTVYVEECKTTVESSEDPSSDNEEDESEENNSSGTEYETEDGDDESEDDDEDSDDVDDSDDSRIESNSESEDASNGSGCSAVPAANRFTGAVPCAVVHPPHRCPDGYTTEFDATSKQATLGDAKLLSPTGFISTYDSESAYHISCRQREYAALWNKIEQIAANTITSKNAETFKAICSFLSVCGVTDTESELPTAVVMAGMNVSDHSMVFSQLHSHIFAKGSFVSTISLKDSSSIESTLRCILSGLVCSIQNMRNKNPTSSEQDDQSGSLRGTISENSVDSNYEQSPITEEWEACLNDKSDPNIFVKFERLCRPYLSSTRPSGTLAVIISDAELLPPKLLARLLAIIADRRQALKLPFVFVLGFATSVDALYRMLPQNILRRLWVDRFRLNDSKICVESLIRELFIENGCPIQLGASPCAFLWEYVLSSDLSVQAFLRGLQFCLLQHFDETPFSHLATTCVADDLSVADIEMLFSLASVKDHSEANKPFRDLTNHSTISPPKRQSKCRKISSVSSSCVNTQITNVEQWLTDYDCYRQNYAAVFDLLFRTSKFVCPGSVLTEASLFQTLQECAVGSNENLIPLFERIPLMTTPDFKTLLFQVWLPFVETQEGNGPLIKFKNTLKELDCALQESEERNRTRAQEKSEDAQIPIALMRFSPAKRRALMLQRSLASNRDCTFAVKEEAAQVLLLLCETHLCQTQTLPLHELFLYNKSKTLSKVFQGCPRSGLLHALQNPSYHMRYGDDSSDLHEDICIAYQVYHESTTRSINVYDWFRAFSSIVKSHEAPKRCRSTDPKVVTKYDRILQARFTRVFSELQFMGCIKLCNRRKIDHVTKLLY